MIPNPAMLRLARQRRGFQQTEAAKRLGIDQPLLSRIEGGLATEIREDFLLRAEQVYETPKTFFYLTDQIYGAPVSVHPMFRRKADVTARDLDGVVAELNIRSIHLRRLFEATDVAYSSSLPKLDIDAYHNDAEEVAAVVRAHWKLPRGPINNLTSLAEQSGVIVVYSNLGGASVSGVTFSTPGLPPLIMLNATQSADRVRFTLAHELGHLIMHRFPSPTMEEEADTFASALLMPNSDIKPYFTSRRIDLATLAALKPVWKVSMQSLLVRAKTLECISANQSQYLWKQISAKRYRLREPPELDFPHEEPTIMSSILRLHMNGLGYSMPELAKLLHEKEADLRSLYNLGEPENKSPRPKLTVIK